MSFKASFKCIWLVHLARQVFFSYVFIYFVYFENFFSAIHRIQYKQKIYHDMESTEDITDTNIFMTSVVPLRLSYIPMQESSVFGIGKNELNCFWKNPRPSSTHYCRPLQFQYARETKDLIQQEVDIVKRKYKNYSHQNLSCMERNL